MSEPAALAAKLRAEGDKLRGFLDDLRPEDWKAEVYTEGSVWTVRNIVAHLMTTERALVLLFDQIRNGGPGVSEDFVIDRYNASQQRKTEALEPAQLLEEFREARTTMVSFVEELLPEDLARTGRHPFLGVTTLGEMIKMVYIHNQTHYRDVRRALGRGPASP